MKSVPASVQRWAVILMPPMALLVCCMVMVPKQKKLREVNKNIKVTEASVQQFLTQLKAISDLPPDPTIATLPATKQEQSDFLRGLARTCTESGNKIISVTALGAAAPPPPPPAGAPPPPGAAGGLPPDVQPIKSTIVFEGNFHALRRFLAGLKGSRRLISLSECRIGPGLGGYPTIDTTLTVTLYVDIPGAGAPPPPTPAAAPKS